jgi:hypothetical protein
MNSIERPSAHAAVRQTSCHPAQQPDILLAPPEVAPGSFLHQLLSKAVSTDGVSLYLDLPDCAPERGGNKL